MKVIKWNHIAQLRVGTHQPSVFFGSAEDVDAHASAINQNVFFQ